MIASSTPHPPAARLVEVSKHYGDPAAGGVAALDRVSLDVPRGELTAVMGPSGSGKSTLMHCLAGLDHATAGRVLVGERDITDLGDRELTLLRRRSIGFVFQAFNLIPTLSAEDNILLPFRLDGRSPSEEESRLIAVLVDALGLTNRLAHRPGELSGGQQQRVAIARALATRPALLIADEPTGNLDSRSAAEVRRLLRSAASVFGQTIVMVTHDPIAASIADSVVFLSDGRIMRHERGLTAADVSAVMIGATPAEVAR